MKKRVFEIEKLKDYVQNYSVPVKFSATERWAVLSDIERSINTKIDTAGTPLKEWNLRINFGIKTGLNDAFIIDSAKRDEILENCHNGDELKRTKEVITPLLRGKDIGRFVYNWADMYMIALFPSRHYDIELYPAIKDYLLSYASEMLIKNGYNWVAQDYLEEYCKKKLEQAGKKEIIINRTKIVDQKGKNEESRKKTLNKWFETQDPITYWRDLMQPKIIWKRIGSILRFSYDDKGFLGLDSTCFATGTFLPYLCCVLNSSMGHYLLDSAQRTGTGDLLISVQAIEPLKVPIINEHDNRFEVFLKRATVGITKELEDEIDAAIFDLYDLEPEERDYIVQNYRYEF